MALKRKPPTTPLPVKSSAGDDERHEPVEEKLRPNGGTTETAPNVLVFSLKTLSNISSSSSEVGVLSGIIDALLRVVEQVQQTQANEQSLTQLAARLERLAPIVTEMAKSDPERGQGIVKKLLKELASMSEQLNEAKNKDELGQFFNSTDNSAILQNHNMALDQMIADSTFVTVHEVAESIRDLENSKMPQLRPEITGGTGGMGASGHVGDKGGEGGGPQIDMDPGERP
ncbi:hypothetical protein MSAN_00539000 [Mycena sanguinolenta]|uniref:Uncharacterized protein n=1 Tax=Mycena sanguinolenta TaxID=230812 RepID=A0A8H6Z6N3_9AGAR|nr:hypothetical protein MSAN_00539000 [Mycena sanguinolenta]